MRQLIPIIVLSLFPTHLCPQTVDSSSFELFESERLQDELSYRVTFLNLASDEESLSHLIFKLTFINDDLQFIKSTNRKFSANYEGYAVILDSSGFEVDSKKWTGFVIAQNFEETNSVSITNATEVSFDLPPNSYNFKIELTDVETGRSGRKEGAVTLRNFAHNGLSVSDVFIIDSLLVAPSSSMLALGDSTNGEPQKEWFAYFEIYHVPESDSIEVAFEILDTENKVVQKGNRILQSQGRATGAYLKLEEKTLVSQEPRIKLHVKGGEKSLDFEQPIDFSDLDTAPAFANLDEAIEQLVYIAKDKELKEMRTLEEDEEKMNAFQEFWKPRDPDPSTHTNEYRDEYYRRVKYATKMFTESRKRPGWKTEMGMVYIKLGPPNFIDTLYGQYNRNVFDATRTNSGKKLILIWQYYRLNKEVIFQYRSVEYRIANYSEVSHLLKGEMHF